MLYISVTLETLNITKMYKFKYIVYVHFKTYIHAVDHENKLNVL